MTGWHVRVMTADEGIRKVVRRLARQGIVHFERVGNAYSYRLSCEHLAAGPVMELARLLATLTVRLATGMSRSASWRPTSRDSTRVSQRRTSSAARASGSTRTARTTRPVSAG